VKLKKLTLDLGFNEIDVNATKTLSYSLENLTELTYFRLELIMNEVGKYGA